MIYWLALFAGQEKNIAFVINKLDNHCGGELYD